MKGSLLPGQSIKFSNLITKSQLYTLRLLFGVLIAASILIYSSFYQSHQVGERMKYLSEKYKTLGNDENGLSDEVKSNEYCDCCHYKCLN